MNSPTNYIPRHRRATACAVVVILGALVSACGGSGAPTTEQPVTTATAPPDYSGPDPATTDVQAFRVSLWDNIKSADRCGGCHDAGGQTPMFARQDDINLAYEAANTIVDLASPADSRMVTKVAGGHNCWQGSDSVCADLLTTWIGDWAGASGTAPAQVQLEPPVLRDAGDSRSFPLDSGLFAATVHPVLMTYCAGCHESAAVVPQSPYFANADLETAYPAAQSKIDLDNPAGSRLVLRLRNEFHNCWSDCAANADTMEAEIANMAGQISPTEVDPALVISKALGLYDGTIASGGNRFDSNVVALYEFKTGSDFTAYDTSGVEPSLDLTLSGDFAWVGGWGVEIRDGKAQGSTAASSKLADLIRATGEYSIEAWVVPANVTQEDARIVSYSGGTMTRNFTLGQTLYNYDFLNRTSNTDANGTPALSTADADEDLQATLQHVALTYDPVNGRRIFVNGQFTDDVDQDAGGTLADWDDTFALVLGNEVSGDRLWQGTLRFVAIHNRALTPAQITQNFDAGVGERFFLLFSVEHIVSVPDSYVVFEVSQFDSYSYLFEEPVFISLDSNEQPDGIAVEGIRIGINGKEAAVGQAYANLVTTVTQAQYTEQGQILSPLGTVIALEKGPDSDEFFLTFDRLGDQTYVRTDPVPLAPPPPVDGAPQSDIGLRLFAEVNASMAEMTGVSPQQTDVATTYTTVQQQLPTVDSIGGFLSSHQVAVAQLAIEYCNALVDDTGLRATYFPGVDFTAPAATAFATPADRDLVLDPLLDRAIGINIATQPDRAAVRTELDSLISTLVACGAGCDSSRTATTVKAVCSGAVGSAVTLLQ